MTTLETARAFEKLLLERGWKSSKPGLLEERFKSEDKFVVSLSIGKGRKFIQHQEKQGSLIVEDLRILSNLDVQ